MDAEVEALCKEFKFTIELEPKDEKVLYLKFDDGRGYRLQHPGALVAARLFGTTTESLTADCLDYFIENCITPIVNTAAKTLTAANLDLTETIELWMPLAWRFLRRGIGIAIGKP